MNTIFWTAYTNDERHTAINKLQNVISRYGDIVDTKFFSDISLNLKIEIEELKIDGLYSELRQQVGIDNFDRLHSKSKRERVIFLNITFSSGTGNLKIELPAVPG